MDEYELTDEEQARVDDLVEAFAMLEENAVATVLAERDPPVVIRDVAPLG